MRKNIPNALSGFRIMLVPVFVASYFADDADVKTGAFIVYALATFTDFLDGYLARKLNQISDIGRILDPIGDKLLNIATLSCLYADGYFPLWVVIVVSSKELIMMVGGIIIHTKYKKDMPSSNICGKASTALFFIVCASLMVFKRISWKLAQVMVSIAVALMFAAFISYIKAFRYTVKDSE